jgi:DNA-binding transcriptional ArsR family regulator
MTYAHDQRRELDNVLGALAHQARRHILLVVRFHGGAISAGEIAARFAHSWPTTSRHLGVLEQAGLLQFEKQGRTRLYRLNRARVQVVEDWLRWFRQPAEAPDNEPAAPLRPEAVLRNIALAYPEVTEEVSAGERVMLVRKRPFLLLRTHSGGWTLSAKLAHSRDSALELPFALPVRYRLGKSDWVAARFAPEEDLPLELLWEWIDESYRSVAPKRLLAEIPGPPGGPQTNSG